MGWGMFALLLLFLVAQAYVRLAPADPARWHMTAAVERQTAADPGRGTSWTLYPPAEGHPPGDWPQDNGFEAARKIDRPAEAVLEDLDRIIRATPRTRRIAGGVGAGMITYETRSLFWGFPDYTTVDISERATQVLRIYGRARFGRGDLGVNEARIRGWLAELKLAP